MDWSVVPMVEVVEEERRWGDRLDPPGAASQGHTYDMATRRRRRGTRQARHAEPLLRYGRDEGDKCMVFAPVASPPPQPQIKGRRDGGGGGGGDQTKRPWRTE